MFTTENQFSVGQKVFKSKSLSGLSIAVLVATILIMGCTAADHASSATASFLNGDFNQVAMAAKQWSDQSKSDPVPHYLRSIALFVKQDFDGFRNSRRIALADTARIEIVRGFAERLVREHGDSPWAHFALACALDISGRSTDAVKHYSEAIRLAPGNPTLSNCLESANLVIAKVKPVCSFVVTPRGKMQPLEGKWGLVRPLNGQFAVEGQSRSSIGSFTASGTISDWKEIFAGGNRAKPIGWGVSLTHGDALLSGEDYEDLVTEKLQYHIENTFISKSLDYLGRYILISVVHTNHAFTIPVVIHSDTKVSPATGVGAGSKYEIAPMSNSPESGLPTKVIMERGVCADLDLDVSLYRTDNGSAAFVGIRIDERGMRLSVNPQFMLLAIRPGSTIRGSQFVCREEMSR